MQQQFEPESMTTTANTARATPRAEPGVTQAEKEAEFRRDVADVPAHQAAEQSPLWLPGEQAQIQQTRVEELLRTIEREAAKSKRTTQIITRVFLAMLLFLVLGAAATLIRTGHFSSDMLTGFGALAGIGGIAAGATKQRKAATQLIAQFEDKRAIGPMIEALGFNDREVTAAVMPALTRQLPQLMASDAALVNSEQRAALGRLLLTRNDTLPVKIPDFYAAILQALQQIGDEKSLPTVEKLAQGEGMATYYPELKAQAKETLPFLRQRVEQARSSQTLLRASAAEQSQPETLLRAAAPTVPAEDPHQLLRADPD